LDYVKKSIPMTISAFEVRYLGHLSSIQKSLCHNSSSYHKQAAFAMDLWETPVSLCFKQQYQYLLGDFFQSLENAAPWFVSLGKPVNEEEGTCLYSLLGFEREKGISFLSSIGLIKKGHSRNPEAISVVSGARDEFLHEEVLGKMMETITKTSAGATLY